MKFRLNKKPAQIGRRNVNVSGRPSAFSYHANRIEQDYNLGRLQPREQDTRRRERLIRFWRQRLGMLLAGIVLIVCVLDILHLSANPSVIALTSSSDNTFLQPTSVYQKAAEKLFADSILNDNKVTINTEAIQADLKHQFPELSDVSVTLPLMGHRPIVYIAPTKPSVILKTASESYVLDDTGKALLKTSQADNLTKLELPIVTDQSGLKVQINDVALPSSSVRFITTVMQELQAKGIAVSSILLPPAAYELDITPSGVGYYIKFNMHANTAMQQTGTFLAVRQRLASQNITPTSYIDVRLDGRAYYK